MERLRALWLVWGIVVDGGDAILLGVDCSGLGFATAGLVLYGAHSRSCSSGLHRGSRISEHYCETVWLVSGITKRSGTNSRRSQKEMKRQKDLWFASLVCLQTGCLQMTWHCRIRKYNEDVLDYAESDSQVCSRQGH